MASAVDLLSQWAKRYDFEPSSGKECERYLEDMAETEIPKVCFYDNNSSVHEPPIAWVAADDRIMIVSDGSGPTGVFCREVSKDELEAALQPDAAPTDITPE